MTPVEALSTVAEAIATDAKRYHQRMQKPSYRLTHEERRILCGYADTLGRIDKALRARELHDKAHTEEAESIRAVMAEILGYLELVPGLGPETIATLREQVLDKLPTEAEAN